jgi:hypothetical protein
VSKKNQTKVSKRKRKSQKKKKKKWLKNQAASKTGADSESSNQQHNLTFIENGTVRDNLIGYSLIR